MPMPVRQAASTPSTAAPGYASEPVRIPTTPREYLSSAAVGLRRTPAASSSVHNPAMAPPYLRSTHDEPAVHSPHHPRSDRAQSAVGGADVPVQRGRGHPAGVASHPPDAVRLR